MVLVVECLQQVVTRAPASQALVVLLLLLLLLQVLLMLLLVPVPKHPVNHLTLHVSVTPPLALSTHELLTHLVMTMGFSS